MKPPKIHNVPYFQYAYIRTPKDMAGTMGEFTPHWWVQYLGNGAYKMFATKQECLDWIKEWDEIGEPV